MKKLLAVIMSVVMAFSIAVVPASAAEKEEITIDEFFETVEASLDLIEDTINQIHNIVGTILGALGKECPMCAEVHEVEFIYGDESETGDVEIELPEEVTSEAVA